MGRRKKFDFIPSRYQQDIFDFIQHGTGNGVIKACAGSGKTRTLVTSIQIIPKSKKCLFIAFNKSIANELKVKLSSNTNCDVRTIHSLGYLMIRRNFGNEVELDEFKYKTYLRKHISELSGISDNFVMPQQEVADYINRILSLIDFARFNLAQTVNEIEKIANKYNIPTMFDEAEVALKCLEWGKNHHDTVDYTDMVWLPVELSLKPMGLQYDWIMFDECQDASLMSIQLFLKCFKRGTRFIAVGDSDQCIYFFAGSSPEAFDYMCNYPNTTVFPLPITYRCPRKVVEFAQRLVSEITARDNAPEGEIIEDCNINMLKDGDMVLCRSNAPLVKLYSKLLRRNKNCYIKGKDMGLSLIKMIEDMDYEKLNPSLTRDGLFVRLYDRLFEERNKMMATKGLNVNDATLSSYIVSMYDSITTLSILAERCNTKKELIRQIECIFKEESEGICLSTVHKAKGLESDNVYILCHSLMPSKLAKKEWEKQQERNLQYVAYTRPKQRLGFISEEEIKPVGMSNEPMAIINDLHNIEMQVCKILNKTPVQNTNDVELAKFRVKTATKVEIPQDDANVVDLQNEDNIETDQDLLSKLSEFIMKDKNNLQKLSEFLNN